jgi:predicted nucleic acid-binding Zn ribbon protein
MKCPYCGTYNPEDRTTCWRCDRELPKPKPQKRRTPQKTAQTWLYVIIGIFLVYTLLQTCGVTLPFMPQTPNPAEPSGGLLPQGPPTAALAVPWARLL